jgi:hypothetical protein
MKLTDPIKTVLSGGEATNVVSKPPSVLNVVVVFQDAPARQWARQIYDKVSRLVGDDAIWSTWWEIHRLATPAVLSDAVQAVAEADIVVVSLQTASEPPPELCAWIEAWLQRRKPDEGALVALIGVQEGAGSQAFRMRDYLRGVARAGRLDFLPHEQKLPSASGRWHEPPRKATARTHLQHQKI